MATCLFVGYLLSVDFRSSSADPAVLPVVIDEVRPQLSWQMQPTVATVRNIVQSAYRILVASDLSLLPAHPDVWDSGKVRSNASIAVTYAGPLIAARTRVYWQVELWDAADADCGVSETSSWETGLLESRDWGGAVWLTRDPVHAEPPPCDFYRDDPASLFRRNFTLSHPGDPNYVVARARVYVTGLGFFKLYLDGARVGDAELDPAVSAYNSTVYYVTYDITAQLRRGAPLHMIGVALGNGWFNLEPLLFWGSHSLRDALPHGDPMFRLALYIEFSNGVTQLVVSEPNTWQVGPSEVTRNSIYLGTVVDRRTEPLGWADPPIVPNPADAWPTPNPVLPGQAALHGKLRAQPIPSVRRTASYTPVSITSSVNGSALVVDLGTQLAGVCTLCVRGAAGATVRSRYGELLFANGSLNGWTSVAGQIKSGNGGPCAPPVAWQEDVYILRGDASGECYSSPFTWHGFRYVELTGDVSVFDVRNQSSLVCHHLMTDLARTGRFESGDDLLNRVHSMHVTTQSCNLMSMQSDCPHRERLGYGGDALMTAEAFMSSFDMAAFYATRLHAFMDDQRGNGGFTETAPFVGIDDQSLGGGSGPIGWQAFAPVGTALHARYYGGVRLAGEIAPALLAQAQLLDAADPALIENGLGDWMAAEPKALGLTGRGFQLMSYAAFSEVAGLAGDAVRAEEYRNASIRIGALINDRWFDNATGTYRQEGGAAPFSGTQCAQALPLTLGIVNATYTAAVETALAKSVEAAGRHMLTGGFGSRWLVMALCDAGRTDLAYAVMAQRTYPSFGYMLNGSANGLTNATTVWESWVASDNTYSHNHPMFSSAQAYFYEGLGGIRPAPGTHGFERVLVRPCVPPAATGLRWARTSLNTVRGVVSTSWAYGAAHAGVEMLNLNVTIPGNMLATIVLPNGTRMETGSGAYQFAVAVSSRRS